MVICTRMRTSRSLCNVKPPDGLFLNQSRSLVKGPKKRFLKLFLEVISTLPVTPFLISTAALDKAAPTIHSHSPRLPPQFYCCNLSLARFPYAVHHWRAARWTWLGQKQERLGLFKHIAHGSMLCYYALWIWALTLPLGSLRHFTRSSWKRRVVSCHLPSSFLMVARTLSATNSLQGQSPV